jgi:hypothetical protein
VDEVDNLPIDESNQSIQHIGAIESKMIKGSDGRLYAIEFMRLTPRDANYVEVSCLLCRFMLFLIDCLLLFLFFAVLLRVNVELVNSLMKH